MKLQLILFVLLLPITAVAQQKFQVNAVLVSENEGETLPFAVISIEEMKEVMYTDDEGRCSFSLRSGEYHLNAFAYGYDQYVYHLKLKSDTQITIELKPKLVSLDEVVVEEDFRDRVNKKSSLDIEYVHFDESEKSIDPTFAEALAKLPGVSAYNTGVGVAKPVIRGFTATRISVYDQGIKQEGQQWGMDHGLEIDPFDAGRVELIKGPSSLEYGSDAAGGVIKLLPEPWPKKGFKSNYTGIYKSNNNSIENSLFASDSKGNSFLSARVSFSSFEDFRVPAETYVYNGFVLPVEDNRLKNTGGAILSIRANYGIRKEGFNMWLNAGRYEQKTGLYSGATGIPRAYEVAPIGRTRSIGLPNQKIIHHRISAKLNTRIAGQWISTNIGYQLNDRTENSEPHNHGYLEIDPDDEVALKLKLHTISLNSKYQNNWGKSSFSLGTSHQYQINRKGGWEYLLPDFNTYNGAVYGILNGAFSSKLEWNSGLRVDYAYVNSSQHLQPWYFNPDSLDERSPDIERSFLNYSISSGLIYNPTSKWNFKLNLSRSFRVPQVAELASNGVHHGTFRHEVGNAELDSEIGYHADMSFNYLGENLLVKLTPFYNYYSNYIYLRPSSRFSTLPDAGQLYLYTQSEVIITGAEFYIDLHPIEGFHISNGLEYIYNFNLDTRLPLPFTPPVSNLLALSYEPISGLKLIGEWRHTLDQERVDRNEPVTPGYDLFNIKIRKSFSLGSTKLNTGLAVLNVFNTAYLNHLSRYRILNLPEQGRNIILNVSLAF